MKAIILSVVCASGLGMFAMNQNVETSAAGDFSSPAAEASYVQSGDISNIASETSFVMDLEENTTVHQWGRSSGCSTGCSMGCSSGCSSGCSMGCSSGCSMGCGRRW